MLLNAVKFTPTPKIQITFKDLIIRSYNYKTTESISLLLRKAEVITLTKKVTLPPKSHAIIEYKSQS